MRFCAWCNNPSPNHFCSAVCAQAATEMPELSRHKALELRAHSPKRVWGYAAAALLGGSVVALFGWLSSATTCSSLEGAAPAVVQQLSVPPCAEGYPDPIEPWQREGKVSLSVQLKDAALDIEHVERPLLEQVLPQLQRVYDERMHNLADLPPSGTLAYSFVVEPDGHIAWISRRSERVDSRIEHQITEAVSRLQLEGYPTKYAKSYTNMTATCDIPFSGICMAQASGVEVRVVFSFERPDLEE